MNILFKFYHYQKSRFPVAILLISLLPAVLSTAAVTQNKDSLFQILGLLLVSVLYLLHIRITDELRDFAHDNKHHTTRPIQSGIISIPELQKINLLAIGTILVISLINNLFTLFVVIILLEYTYIAGKEFFLGNHLRKHFFLYNTVNTLQMILLQIYSYMFLFNGTSLNHNVLIHFLFTSTGTIIFELARKIKVPGHDGTGKDTYSYFIGFKKSLIIYVILVGLNIYFAHQLLINSHFYSPITAMILTFFTLYGLFWPYYHSIKQNKRSEQLMQLSFIFLYAIINILIYIKI